MKKHFFLFAALSWCLAVTLSYFAVNHAYYVEKVTVFGEFFLSYVN